LFVVGVMPYRKNSKERWWLKVTGKGGKIRLVPATHGLMAELIRYRRPSDLAPLPREGETTPLLLPLIGPMQPTARSAVHEVVKDVVRRTPERLRAKGSEFEAAAAHIEKASTHWMRHTVGTYQSDRVDMTSTGHRAGWSAP
jgi:integrase